MQLAERISRTEPDIPSIQTPLAHEATISQTPELPKHDDRSRTPERDVADSEAEPPPLGPPDLAKAPDSTERLEETRARTWPRQPATRELAVEGLERDDAPGWEP